MDNPTYRYNFGLMWGDQVVRYLYQLASEMGVVGDGQASPIPAVATAWQQHKHHTMLLETQLLDVTTGLHDLANHMSVPPSCDYKQTLMDIKQIWTDTHQRVTTYRQKCQRFKKAKGHIKGLEERLRVREDELLRAQQRIKDLEALLQTFLHRENEPHISSSSDADSACSNKMSMTQGDDLSSSVSLTSPEDNTSVATDLTASTDISSSGHRPPHPAEMESVGSSDEEHQPNTGEVLLFLSPPTPPDSETAGTNHHFQQTRPLGDYSPQEFLGQDRQDVLPPIIQTELTPGDFPTASLSADLDSSNLGPATPSNSAWPLDEEAQASTSPVLLNFIYPPTPPDSDATGDDYNHQHHSPQEFLGQDRENILPPVDPAGLAPSGFCSASSTESFPSQASPPVIQTGSAVNRSGDQNTPPTSASSSSLDSSGSDSSTSSPGVQAWTNVAAFASIHQVMQSVTPPRCNNMVRGIKDLALWAPTSISGNIELGRGANGAVYLFRHAKTQDPIALKSFPLSTDPERRRHQLFNMQEEASIQKELGAHRHFPRYYGYVPLDGHTLTLAMEFVGDCQHGRSTTLSEALYSQSYRWQESVAFRIAIDVAEGINIMHREGFLINDLKSNNVLLSLEGGILRAKVIDFGHATRVNSLCRVYRLSDAEKVKYRTKGLYNHIAPEVALDNQYPSVRSDTFQVGKILTEMGLRLHLDALQNIGYECCDINPLKRPNLEYIVAVLKAIQPSAP